MVLDIFVTPEKLSDNSIVWNVVFGGHTFAAADEDGALIMADLFSEAIKTSVSHEFNVVVENWKL